ncbi:hypothetical protein [Glaesserella sp.]|uniref:hypothetical protein n=1 Tax=Glaesserella sp. TaxID=2094731 RepID=UPI00359FFE65
MGWLKAKADITTDISTEYRCRNGFVYAVKPGGIDVNATLGPKKPYPHEMEIAAPREN